MTVNEFLSSKSGSPDYFTGVRPCINCVDGFNVSVQASDRHYCIPRENEGPWTEVELGYPSQSVHEIMEYAEHPDSPTGSVYGYVPVDIVDSIIAAHGGIVAA